MRNETINTVPANNDASERDGLTIFMMGRGYPTKEYPLNGVFEYDQAKALAKMGHKVVFGALDLRSIKRKRELGYESFLQEGVQVEALNLPLGNLGKGLTQSIRIQAFGRLYKKMVKNYGEPQVVHAQFINVGHAATRVLTRGNAPLIYTEHFSGMNKEVLSPYLRKLGEETYSQADNVIAVSSYLAGNMNRHFGVNPTVIPNIVDTGRFDYSDHPEGTTKNSHFQFLSVGSLQPHKETALLIQAFYEAFPRNPEVTLKIIGDGPEKESLQKQIRSMNLQDRVQLMGQRERQEIAEEMKRSRAFVLASKLETFGVAFIEAMAAGLPVLSLAKGGPEDFIKEKNGILIPGGDKEDLIAGMMTMVERIEGYDRKGISREAKERFSPEAIGKRLTEMYRREVEGSRR